MVNSFWNLKKNWFPKWGNWNNFWNGDEGMVYFCPKNKTGSQMDVLNMVNIVECKGRPHIFNTWSLSPKRSFQNVMCKSQDIDWQNAKDVSRSQLSSIKWSHLMWVCSYSPLLELTTIKLRNQHLFLQYFYTLALDEWANIDIDDFLNQTGGPFNLASWQAGPGWTIQM